MLTKTLQQVVDQASELDQQQQTELAGIIAEFIDEAQWTEEFGSPEGQAALNLIFAEGEEEIRLGHVEEGGFDGR